MDDVWGISDFYLKKIISEIFWNSLRLCDFNNQQVIKLFDILLLILLHYVDP